LENSFSKISIGLKNIINSLPKSLKVEDYQYSLIKIIPYKSGYKDDDFEKIMNTLSKYNNGFFDRFEIDKINKVLKYHPTQALGFEIYFTKDKISYNYAIPTIYKTVFMNKLKYLLHDCDVVVVDDYISEFNNSMKVKYQYKDNWFLSLNNSKGINLADSLMIINSDLQNEEDKVLVQYLFKPLFDFQWKSKWDDTWKAYTKTGILKNSGGILEKMDLVNDKFMEQLDLVINAIMEAFGGDSVIEHDNTKENFTKDLSVDTKHKTTQDGFKVNMNLYIKSNSGIVVDNISRNVNTILQDLAGDNSLTIDRSKPVVEASRKFNGGMILNTSECRQLVKTPSAPTLLKYDDLLDKINVAELDVPKELLQGKGINIGEIMLGSTYKKMTFGTDSNSLSKPLFYLGEMEAGKSSFARMYGIDALEQGHSVFMFDTIDGKNITHVRDYLPKTFPEDKIIVLDFKNEDYAFPCLWNEVSDYYKIKLDNAIDDIDRYRVMEEYGSIVSSELERFIDVLQTDHKEQQLSTAMRDILNKLSQLVFMTGGCFGDISKCLHDENLRHELLDKLNIPYHLPFCISILDLDEDKSEVTLRGIETRLNLIMKNNTLKKYFTVNPTDKKLDFTKWSNEGYAVLIRIPEQISNVLVTFLTQKLWLSTITTRYDMKEEDRPHTHLLIDEPNRFPSIMDLLKDNFIASRKWHLRFLFFIHNMSIFKDSLDNLKSAGVSIIMTPTNEKNFKICETFFKPMEYEALEEVKKLIAKGNGKLRYALCSIHYKSVNYPCVVKLPLPVEMRYKKIDRSYLNDKCAKAYGISQREYYEDLFRGTLNNEGDSNSFDSKEIAI
jgi:hypothetical protein